MRSELAGAAACIGPQQGGAKVGFSSSYLWLNWVSSTFAVTFRIFTCKHRGEEENAVAPRTAASDVTLPVQNLYFRPVGVDSVFVQTQFT